MDVTTLAVGAAISAIVSAIVSLLTVSQMVTRQSRAERADAALQGIRAVADALLLDLRKYQANMLASAKREPGVTAGEDYVRASSILMRIGDLPRWRRALIRRRVRILFGDFLARVATVSPVHEGDTSLGSIAPLLIAQHQQQTSTGPVLTAGLVHASFCRDPGDPLLRKLDRHLRLLAAGW